MQSGSAHRHRRREEPPHGEPDLHLGQVRQGHLGADAGAHHRPLRSPTTSAASRRGRRLGDRQRLHDEPRGARDGRALRRGVLAVQRGRRLVLPRARRRLPRGLRRPRRHPPQGRLERRPRRTRRSSPTATSSAATPSPSRASTATPSRRRSSSSCMARHPRPDRVLHARQRQARDPRASAPSCAACSTACAAS